MRRRVGTGRCRCCHANAAYSVMPIAIPQIKSMAKVASAVRSKTAAWLLVVRSARASACGFRMR